MEREIGPVGTGARLLAGAALVVVPIIAEDVRLWDVAGAVVAGPVIAAASAAAVRRSGRTSRVLAPWSPASLAVLGLVIACMTALTFLTPVDQPAIWLFLGLSMLLAAARGQGGCEVLAIPNLVTGRDDRVACLLYGPIDAAEGRGART